MILQLEVSDERPIDLPSVPTEEPATPAKGKTLCEILLLPLTCDAFSSRARVSIPTDGARPSRSMI